MPRRRKLRIFREIIPQKKIVFEHSIRISLLPFFLRPTVQKPGLFDTAEMGDIIGKVHKADEGQKQNVENLAAYLSKLRTESRPK